MSLTFSLASALLSPFFLSVFDFKSNDTSKITHGDAQLTWEDLSSTVFWQFTTTVLFRLQNFHDLHVDV